MIMTNARKLLLLLRERATSFIPSGNMECGAFISMTTTREYLYHGSPNHIQGKVEPRQGKDISKKPEKNLFGIYATDNIEIAIAKALLSCEGVKGLTSLDSERKEPPYGVVFSGWPRAECVYIYKLPIATFRQVSENSWVSSVPVIPIEVREKKVRGCIHLVRKATLLERIYLFKYGPTSALRYLGLNRL